MAKSAATKGEKTPTKALKTGAGTKVAKPASAGKKTAKHAGGAVAGERRWHPLPVRLEFGSAFTRHVFLRAPTKGAEGAAEGLALFVAAVPAGWNESHLRELMEIFGVVAEASLVVLDSAPDVAGGLVRFEDDKAIRRALAAATPGGEPVDPPSSLARPVGLDAWVGDHRAARPGPEALQTRIDEWFLEFEAEEERKARAAKAAAAADDGWTVVEAKRGRRKTTDDEGTAVGGIRAATADQRRKPGLQPKENFYRFQQREQRRSELYDLKLKFAADKERVAKLKASRKFRPL